jgi:hypothetical protein
MTKNPLDTLFAHRQELEDAMHMVEDTISQSLHRMSLYFDPRHPRKLHYALFYRLACGAAQEKIPKEQLLVMIEAAYDPRNLPPD